MYHHNFSHRYSHRRQYNYHDEDEDLNSDENSPRTHSRSLSPTTHLIRTTSHHPRHRSRSPIVSYSRHSHHHNATPSPYSHAADEPIYPPHTSAIMFGMPSSNPSSLPPVQNPNYGPYTSNMTPGITPPTPPSTYTTYTSSTHPIIPTNLSSNYTAYVPRQQLNRPQRSPKMWNIAWEVWKTDRFNRKEQHLLGADLTNPPWKQIYSLYDDWVEENKNKNLEELNQRTRVARSAESPTSKQVTDFMTLPPINPDLFKVQQPGIVQALKNENKYVPYIPQRQTYPLASPTAYPPMPHLDNTSNSSTTSSISSTPVAETKPDRNENRFSTIDANMRTMSDNIEKLFTYLTANDSTTSTDNSSTSIPTEDELDEKPSSSVKTSKVKQKRSHSKQSISDLKHSLHDSPISKTKLKLLLNGNVVKTAELKPERKIKKPKPTTSNTSGTIDNIVAVKQYCEDYVRIKTMYSLRALCLLCDKYNVHYVDNMTQETVRSRLLRRVSVQVMKIAPLLKDKQQAMKYIDIVKCINYSDPASIKGRTAYFKRKRIEKGRKNNACK
jgi:hypothetical protein